MEEKPESPYRELLVNVAPAHPPLPPPVILTAWTRNQKVSYRAPTNEHSPTKRWRIILIVVLAIVLMFRLSAFRLWEPVEGGNQEGISPGLIICGVFAASLVLIVLTTRCQLRFAFSLRMLFAATTVICVSVGVGNYLRQWIAGRHDFRNLSRDIRVVRYGKSPLLLRPFNLQGYDFLGLNPDADPEVFERAAELFPEAKIGRWETYASIHGD